MARLDILLLFYILLYKLLLLLKFIVYMSRRVQYEDKGKKEDNTNSIVKPKNNNSNASPSTSKSNANNNFNPNMSSYSFKEDENDPVKSLPTHKYLQCTVVQALSDGMFKVSQDKPNNPIEYLGRFLLEQSRINKQQIQLSNKR